MQRKCNPVWALFGNEDDPIPPAWHDTGRPQWLRSITWWFRNPAHNFMFYVLGIADRNRVLVSMHGTDVHPPEGGWLCCTTQIGKLKLPFVSYLGTRIKCYAGWRPAGACGIKFNILKKQ